MAHKAEVMCNEPGCHRTAKAKGACLRHYHQRRRAAKRGETLDHALESLFGTACTVRGVSRAKAEHDLKLGFVVEAANSIRAKM